MSYLWCRVPPNYWEEATRLGMLGGAFGFSTEISPGAAPLLIDAAERYLGAEHLWPVDDVWDYHCGSEQGLFGSLRFFSPTLAARFGPSSSAAEFLALSQAMAYDAHRAMFEAYAAYKYNNATGEPRNAKGTAQDQKTVEEGKNKGTTIDHTHTNTCWTCEEAYFGRACCLLRYFLHAASAMLC